MLSRTQCLALVFLTTAIPTLAQLPITGRPVPQLAGLDTEFESFMLDYQIGAGVLAVMKDECIVYQRGFGSDYFGAPLPEITPMRTASNSKPICAEAAYAAASQGLFKLSDKAFALGQPGGGILNVAPWPSLGSESIKNITVQQLIDHQAGFASNCSWGGDCVYGAIEIATAMGVPSPPGPTNTINFILGQPLLYEPGTDMLYTNFAYLVLSRIIEVRSGMSFISYVRQHVLTADMWVPSTDLLAARTFRLNQSPREPLYKGGMSKNIFNPGGPLVQECYGGIDYEQADGYAGIVASAAPLLKHTQVYGWNYNGSLPGTSTTKWTYPGDVGIVVLLNTREGEPPGEHLASIGRERVYDILQTIIAKPGFIWPTLCVDGFWVDFAASGSGTGGYSDPFTTVSSALAATADGSKLRLRAGSTNWTGAISKKLRIDAPLGMASIGK